MKINASQLKDRAKAEALIAEANALMLEANKAEEEILRITEEKISR